MAITWANKKTQTIECKQGAVRAVRYNVDGNYCLTCGSDKSVKLWSPHRGLLLKTYHGHGYEVLDAHSSSDNSHFCSGGMDKTVALTDVSSGKTVRKFRDHAAMVNCVQFNEESTVILSGSLDASVRAWDVRSRSHVPIQILDEAKDSVTCVQVSDHEVLTASADCKIRRYDLRIGKLFTDFVGNPVSCVRLTRDAQCVLTSSQGASLKLMDKDTGEMLNEYAGMKNSNYKIEACLNQADTHVVSGSEDGRVYVWDLVEAKLIDQLEHPSPRPVASLAPHPSLPCLLTTQGDSLYLWECNTDAT